MESYKEEVKARWGNTESYKEYDQRGNSNNDGLMSIFKELGAIRHLSANNEKAQEGIIGLQNFITNNYYTCTKEILLELGEMYVGDERFKNNIETVGGEGTADFVNSAIKIYCSK